MLASIPIKDQSLTWVIKLKRRSNCKGWKRQLSWRAQFTRQTTTCTTRTTTESSTSMSSLKALISFRNWVAPRIDLLCRLRGIGIRSRLLPRHLNQTWWLRSVMTRKVTQLPIDSIASSSGRSSARWNWDATRPMWGDTRKLSEIGSKSDPVTSIVRPWTKGSTIWRPLLLDRRRSCLRDTPSSLNIWRRKCKLMQATMIRVCRSHRSQRRRSKHSVRQCTVSTWDRPIWLRLLRVREPAQDIRGL